MIFDGMFLFWICSILLEVWKTHMAWGGFWDFDWPSPIKIPMVMAKIWIGTSGDFDGKQFQEILNWLWSYFEVVQNICAAALVVKQLWTLLGRRRCPVHLVLGVHQRNGGLALFQKVTPPKTNILPETWRLDHGSSLYIDNLFSADRGFLLWLLLDLKQSLCQVKWMLKNPTEAIGRGSWPRPTQASQPRTEAPRFLGRILSGNTVQVETHSLKLR